MCCTMVLDLGALEVGSRGEVTLVIHGAFVIRSSDLILIKHRVAFGG
jgi:hypothetical protein